MTEQQLRDCVAALLPGQANAPDREKVLRYYRQGDRVRSLVARLLPRFLLATRFNVPWESIRFSATPEGRPFVSAPLQLPVHVDFNISHDSDWVVMAFSVSPPTGDQGATKVGADVMALQLPRYEQDIRSFVQTMDMALTAGETRWVLEPLHTVGGEKTALARLFMLWTYKEAYTKNLGMGLGFDFSRIQFDFPSRSEPSLSIDGKVQEGYRFVDVLLPTAAQSDVSSQLVVCHGPLVENSGFGKQITAEQAVQKGLLRMFSLEQLVTCVQEAI